MVAAKSEATEATYDVRPRNGPPMGQLTLAYIDALVRTGQLEPEDMVVLDEGAVMLKDWPETAETFCEGYSLDLETLAAAVPKGTWADIDALEEAARAATEAPPAPPAATRHEAADALTSEDIPPWLRNPLPVTSVSHAPEPEPEPAPEDEIPPWLQDPLPVTSVSHETPDVVPPEPAGPRPELPSLGSLPRVPRAPQPARSPEPARARAPEPQAAQEKPRPKRHRAPKLDKAPDPVTSARDAGSIAALMGLAAALWAAVMWLPTPWYDTAAGLPRGYWVHLVLLGTSALLLSARAGVDPNRGESRPWAVFIGLVLGLLVGGIGPDVGLGAHAGSSLMMYVGIAVALEALFRGGVDSVLKRALGAPLAATFASAVLFAVLLGAAIGAWVEPMHLALVYGLALGGVRAGLAHHGRAPGAATLAHLVAALTCWLIVG